MQDLHPRCPLRQQPRTFRDTIRTNQEYIHMRDNLIAGLAASVTQTDIEASNGAILVIDAVVLPPAE